MNKPPKTGVALVSFMIGPAFTVPLSNLSNILAAVNETFAIISTHDPIDTKRLVNLKRLYFIPYQFGPSRTVQTLKYGILQVQISQRLFSLRKDLKCVIFFMEPPPLLPILVAKTVRVPIFWLLPSQIIQFTTDIKSRVERFLSKVCYRLCERIIIYSPILIPSWQLEPYREKIIIGHEHFLNFNTLSVTTPFADRPNQIGFIGRLSEEKGILDFVEALPEILGDRQNLHVFIGGGGELKESVETLILELGLTDRVTLYGWIPHDALPHHLNQLRLLILPSYTEGLPNIMLEAMACGTPVLATPVGAIPDVIIDGKTGFIMEGNSPTCIATNVARALSSPEIEQIAHNGRRLVQQEFTFENVVRQWNEILKDG